MGPPATGSRDHLKIEKDGRLINRALAPDIPDRDGRGGGDARLSGRSPGPELVNGSQPQSAGTKQIENKNFKYRKNNKNEHFINKEESAFFIQVFIFMLK